MERDEREEVLRELSRYSSELKLNGDHRPLQVHINKNSLLDMTANIERENVDICKRREAKSALTSLYLDCNSDKIPIQTSKIDSILINERQGMNFAEAKTHNTSVERKMFSANTSLWTYNKTEKRVNSMEKKFHSTSLGFSSWEQEMTENLKRRKHHPVIDRNSAKIARGKNKGNTPAFMRLYARAAERSKTVKEERLMKTSSSLSAEAGERMYEDCVRRKARWERKRSRLKSEQEEREARELTFHPRTNPVSNALLRTRSLASTEDRLIKFGQLANEKKSVLRDRKRNEEVRVYDFKPRVNLLSSTMDRARHSRTQLPRHELLFNEAKRRANIRKSTAQSATKLDFKPDTTLTHKFNRNVQCRFAQNVRRRRLSVCEQECGPKVGRAPRVERNSAKLPIGNYLYSQKKSREEYNEKRTKEEYNKLKALASTPIIKGTSVKLLERMKEKSYKKLFDMLDSDGDGLIGTGHINTKGNFNK